MAPQIKIIQTIILTGFPGVLDFLESPWILKFIFKAWKLLDFSCFCYNVFESPWKHKKHWTFFKVIVLNYLYFPKFPSLMMLRFLPVSHDIWELPRLTIFWINLNKYPHLSTTDAKIVMRTFNLHVKRLKKSLNSEVLSLKCTWMSLNLVLTKPYEPCTYFGAKFTKRMRLFDSLLRALITNWLSVTWPRYIFFQKFAPR